MDLETLAKKYGGAVAQPADLNSLAKKYGGSVVSPIQPSLGPDLNKFGSTVKSIGGALASSEIGLGQDIAAASTALLPGSMTGIKNAKRSISQTADDTVALAKLIRDRKSKGMDTAALEQGLKGDMETLRNMPGATELYPALAKSNLQVVGDIAGTALDLLSAGEYGAATKAMEAGKLFTPAAREAANLASQAITKNIIQSSLKPTLGTTLKTIGKETLARSAVGGGVGYASDVSQNLKEGKTGTDALTPGLGTAAGVITPALIGGVRAGVSIGREEAPRLINSLIKTKKANFSYGKNPGRAVSELGIVGNSLQDFEHNINQAKRDVGTAIGDVYANPANANITINANEDIDKLNGAIKESAKGGKNNQKIVEQFKNVRDALLFEHGVDAEGNIVKQGTMARDFNNLSPQEAQDLIQQVSEHTRFTGSPTDDKAVNSVLKDIYAGIREKITGAVSGNNPEITKLNEQYGDLTTALLALRNRQMMLQGSDFVSSGIKTGAGAAAGVISAVLSGGAAIPVILAGVAGAGLEKALETTAVKTRVASWVAKSTPKAIKEITKKNPQLVPILIQAFPNLVNKLR